MENNVDITRFEFRLRLLMKGYINDYNDLAYILCYLCYVDSKIENSPYNKFDEEYIKTTSNSFEDFINAVDNKFKNVGYGAYKENISDSIKYLREFRFSNIDGRSLIDLLKTKDVYFYENLLISNSFMKNRIRNNDTPSELIDVYKYFATGSSYLDVGCGNGNTLIGLSYKNSSVIRSDGIEINDRNAFISKLRMSLCHGIDSNIISDDYLSYSFDDKYSFITIDMPFMLHIPIMKRREINTLKNDYRFDWNISPAISSEWAFANKALNLLKHSGRIILVTPQTPLFKNGDNKIRKDLVDHNLVEYIIDMPHGSYPGVSINYSLVILNNDKKDDYVKFIDASECFFQDRPNKRMDVKKVLSLFEDNSSIKNIKNSTIAENDYILLASKYMDIDKKSKLVNSTKISDLNIEVTRGYQLFSKQDEKENGKYSIVTITDIDDDGNISNELKRFDTDRDIDKYLLRENDILISTRGNKIKTCIIKELKNKYTIYHGNLSLIRINDDRVDPLFLKLFLDSKRGQIELKSIQTGTIIISINTSQLLNICIPLLSISEQRKIVNEYKFKKNEIIALSNRLSDLQNELSDSINQVFEDVK